MQTVVDATDHRVGNIVETTFFRSLYETRRTRHSLSILGKAKMCAFETNLKSGTFFHSRLKTHLSTNRFHHSLVPPTGLPSLTVLDGTYSAQWFSFLFTFLYFLFWVVVE